MQTELYIKPQLWRIPAIPATVTECLSEKTAGLQQRLQLIVSQHPNAKFASSLAVEDMVITDVLAKMQAGIEVFTLNTGRLNAETLALADTVGTHYPKLTFRLYTPEAAAAEAYILENGPNAFYESIELRKTCCRIRKVEPLNKALADADAWLTGQRRGQSVTRTELPFVEEDNSRGILKYNPIYDWSEAEVWAYILQNQVPYNPLYEQGYPSIGCEPCTRPVRIGEDIRAGRWWWESQDSKECGLHK
ncbi:phosphoadenylyl-sulfate reductase [Neisseria canis]|uniref:Adenosine 5'-phosphosulfate reductase n=1 Tax=Neisseria canis TaxID=493 RepID=A0A448D6L1_9NEIS|nr:phosphoadenosine phosphosulfate reductase [Neisseria canis]